MVCGIKMGVGVGVVGNRGEDVICSGGNVIRADGGGARWKDCCRFPHRIFGKLWEDIAETPGIGTLGDSPTRPIAAAQGSHHHLVILKTTAQFNT